MKRSTELSEYCKHLRSFNLTILNQILYILGFYYICFFFRWGFKLILTVFSVLNLFSGMREGVALSNGYIILICFHTFVIFLKYFYSNVLYLY